MKIKHIFIAAILMFLAFANNAQAQSSESWYLIGGKLRPNLSTWGIRVPSLANCDTIDTNANGDFACGTDSVGGGGSELNWTYFNMSGIRVSTTTNQVLIGATATTSSAKLEVNGNVLVRSALTAYDTVTGNIFTATSTSATSTFPYASSTQIAVNGDHIRDFTGTGLQLSGQSLTTTLGTSISVTELSSEDFGDFTCNGTTCTLDQTYLTSAITSIGDGYSTTTGPAVTFATSTLTVNGQTHGLTIIRSGTKLTLTPTLTGTLDNAGLTNSTVSYGGVSLSLGGSDATPAFDLTDATSLPIVAGTTGTLTIARGGTNQTAFPSRTLVWFDGTSLAGTTTSPLTVGSLISTTTATSTFSGGIQTPSLYTTGGLRLGGLTSCDTLDTTSDGTIVCGSDATGGGSLSGGSPFTLTYWTSDTAVSATSSPTIGYLTATTTATSSFTGGIRTDLLYVASSTATSTFVNGLISTGGLNVTGLASCDTIDTDASGRFKCGSDATGGGGGGDSVWSRNVTTNLIYHATTTDSVAFGVTATSSAPLLLVDNSRGFIGVATSTPYAKLSVVGEVVARNFTATSTTATSSFWGGLEANNDRIFSDYNSGSTTISQLYTGNQTFDVDAGFVNWVDLPIVSAASNTPQGYTATLNGRSALTVLGYSTGSAIDRLRVGFGTSTPSSTFDFFSTGTTTLTIDSSSVTQAACIKMRDVDGTGFTYLTAANGVLSASTVSCE